MGWNLKRDAYASKSGTGGGALADDITTWQTLAAALHLQSASQVWVLLSIMLVYSTLYSS
jgi:hypothetical protein